VSLSLQAAQRIFVYQGCCDMRRSFDRLAAMVEHEMTQDPMAGDCFLFTNRRGHMVKLLYWDGDGFVIWFKRLERGLFRLGDVHTLDRASLAMILDGLEARELTRLKRYKKEEKNVMNH